MKKRKAFTLAEVLITLGIIGIVAAMTLPIVISKYRAKVVEARLAETYSLVYQALKRAEADYGESKHWMRDYASPQDDMLRVMNLFIDTYLVPYIKSSVPDRISAPGYLYKYGYNVRNIPYLPTAISSGTKVIRLNNGVIMFISYHHGRQGMTSIRLIVDINGPKQPNLVGRDIFEMLFSLYDGILFMSGERQIKGYESSYSIKIQYNEILKRCQKEGDALGMSECGALIKLNGWKIPKDYPYKI